MRRAGISGKLVVLLILIATAAGPLTVYLYLNLLPHATSSLSMTGSLFVNDAGKPNGTSGHSAKYGASLSVAGGSGTMNLTLMRGSRDVLTQHTFLIRSLTANDSKTSMLVDGNAIAMVLVTNGTAGGGQYGGYFVASWGPGAPIGELRGSISPSFFPGLGTQYYVELILTPVRAPQPTFLQIRAMR